MNNETEKPDDSSAVVEAVAERVHETWMKGRISEGWTYGTERNDAEKRHPCIVPYGNLPESEKEYDRETTRCVIRALSELGFKISR